MRFECEECGKGYSSHYEDIEIGEQSVVPCQNCGAYLIRISGGQT